MASPRALVAALDDRCQSWENRSIRQIGDFVLIIPGAASGRSDAAHGPKPLSFIAREPPRPIPEESHHEDRRASSAANLIDEATPLVNGTTVGQALDEALRLANDPDATKQKRNEIKNVLDAINNNVNTALGDECVSEENGEVGVSSPAPPSPSPTLPQTPPPGKLTICHKGKRTLSISAAAWPAHQAQGDTMGPCVP